VAFGDTAHLSLWRPEAGGQAGSVRGNPTGSTRSAATTCPTSASSKATTACSSSIHWLRPRPRPPAVRLYRQHRGDSPVVAVIYTHSHGMGVTVGAARRDQLRM